MRQGEQCRDYRILAQRLNAVGNRSGLNEGDSFGIYTFSFDQISGNDVLQCCKTIDGDSFADQIFGATNLRVGNEPKK